MSYDGVIFDFDGVLLDARGDDWRWAAEARRAKAKELGYRLEEYARAGFLFRTDSLEEMKELVEENGFSWQDYLRMEKFAASRKAEMVENGEIKLFTGARDVLQQLEVPMAVVSNAFGDTVDDIIRDLGLDSHLEFWTAPRLSEIEKYHELMKPETHMLEDAMEALNTENVVMVGDSNFDIRAAENAGIDSVFIDTYRDEVEAKPDYRISELAELERIVNGSQH